MTFFRYTPLTVEKAVIFLMEKRSYPKEYRSAHVFANIFPDKLHKKFLLVTDQKVFAVL